MPRVSVVIPCYNQGGFLEEAVHSVLAQTYRDVEIVIVDDGSTDGDTVARINGFRDDRIAVVTTANEGLAAARNNGIARARGEYILPLDADDLIGPAYLEEAVAVLDSDPGVGIVYCRARLFGAVEAEWNLPDYRIEEMLFDNVIFCSALFRRSDWELVGGYDEGMVYGWEDYEFWLALIERNRGVHRLDGHHFSYRVSADSMARSQDRARKVAMFARIYRRHAAFIGAHIEVWLDALIDIRERYLTCRLYVDCGDGWSDASSSKRKVELGRNRVTFRLDEFPGRRGLRFDPVDSPACLRLQAIELGRDGAWHDGDLEPVDANAVSREETRFLFATGDPQMRLPIAADELGRLAAIRITFELESVGEKALQDIIASLARTGQTGQRPGFRLFSRFSPK